MSPAGRSGPGPHAFLSPDVDSRWFESGADGSLFVADDVGGTIYKVSYKGK